MHGGAYLINVWLYIINRLKSCGFRSRFFTELKRNIILFPIVDSFTVIGVSQSASVGLPASRAPAPRHLHETRVIGQ